MSETVQARPRYDELLAASRRIDWRFLLPDAELGHVACSANADRDLLHACRLFAASLTILEQAEPGSRAPVDVLVLVDPERDELGSGVELLRPGGWVYLEVHGVLTRRGRRLRRPRLPSDYADELRRRGLREIEIHWHWPDFASCTEIMPLGEPSAIRAALARRRGSGSRTALLALARLLLAARVLSSAVPHASVIGQRPAEERP